ncbi:MAG TPA: FAD:protein FMN transferase [Mycobacteriales bacterium]|nr:FAD:protein FMN transferase [Mycobacteriales bacterium]
MPAGSVAPLLPATLPATPADTPAVAAWDAWSTGVRLAVTRPERLDAARAAVQASLATIDAAASRFRSDSELSRLRHQPGRWQPVSPLLADLLAAALRAAALTDGAVDPTVGGSLIALGYDRTFPEVPAQGPALRVVRRAAGWRCIELDEPARRVRIPAEVTLDLGATAKARAADLAATAAVAATGADCGVLVSLGGDVAVAGPAPAGGWVVRISDRHEHPPAAAAAEPDGTRITLSGGGLATSSITGRHWIRGGRPVHHLVDPLTGLPPRPLWRTVSVAAGNCLDANTASTASIVRGPGAEHWLAGRGLPARLVRIDGTVVTVAGWPAAPGRGPA